MNKEKDSFIWIKNASTQCFVALFPESTKTMLSWQGFWLIPLWMPSHPPGGQWLVEYSKILEGLTAAGLFRIYTWFPFNCFPRKGVANQCGTKIGSLFVFSKLGGYSFSFVLIRKRKNQLVLFDIFCIFVNETVTYYKIYQISGF